MHILFRKQTRRRSMISLNCSKGSRMIHLHKDKNKDQNGFVKKRNLENPRRYWVFETYLLVRETGLEPVRVTPHAPQTCASAYSATLAIASILYHLRQKMSSLFSEKLNSFLPFVFCAQNSGSPCSDHCASGIFFSSSSSSSAAGRNCEM